MNPTSEPNIIPEKYKDIIDHPGWEPKHHPRMATESRAAQFAAFAALSGHDEAIAATARATQSPPPPELGDYPHAD